MEFNPLIINIIIKMTKKTFCLLIPVTSRNRNWIIDKDSYLISILLDSLLKIDISKINLRFYIGYDSDDKFYIENIYSIKKTFEQCLDCRFFYYSFLNEKKSCVYIWNKLFSESILKNDNDYFFQLGDDIKFIDKNIFNEIEELFLSKKDNVLVWPLDSNNQNIPTQSVVSRNHYKIFGYYFEPTIENWYCDDWIGGVYKNNIIKTKNCVLHNSGGEPRYQIKPVCNLNQLITEGYTKIFLFLKKRIDIIHTYSLKTSTVKQPPGFGDFLRGSIALYQLSKKFPFDLKIDFSNHPLGSYIDGEKYDINSEKIYEYFNTNPIEFIKKSIFSENSFFVYTNFFYENPLQEDERNFMKSKLNFSREIINKAEERILTPDYSTLHLRFTDDEFIKSERDMTELYEKLISLQLKNITVISSNQDQCKKLCEKFNFHFYPSKPVHLGECTGEITDTLIDFIVLSKSKKIYSWSAYGGTGFSYFCSQIFDIPYIKLN